MAESGLFYLQWETFSTNVDVYSWEEKYYNLIYAEENVLKPLKLSQILSIFKIKYLIIFFVFVLLLLENSASKFKKLKRLVGKYSYSQKILLKLKILK